MVAFQLITEAFIKFFEKIFFGCYGAPDPWTIKTHKKFYKKACKYENVREKNGINIRLIKFFLKRASIAKIDM